MEPSPHHRIADSDRDATVEQLRKAYAEGRLDMAEFEERTEQAMASKTYAELQSLVTDLPPVDTIDSGVVKKARTSPRPSGPTPVKGKDLPVARFLLVMSPAVTCVVIWALTNPGGYFWPAWVFLGLGIGFFSDLAKRRRR